MIVTVHNPDKSVDFTIDTTNPRDLQIANEDFTEYLDNGLETFEFDVSHNNSDWQLKRFNRIQDRNYISIKIDDEIHIFTIIKLTKKRATKHIMAGTPNLELLNENIDKYEGQEPKTFAEYLKTFAILDDEKLQIGKNELTDVTKQLIFDNVETVIKRITSLAEQFGAELKFRSEFADGRNFTRLVLDIYKAHADAKKDELTGETIKASQGRGRKRDEILREGSDFFEPEIEIDKSEIATIVYPIGQKTVKKKEKQLLPVTKKLQGAVASRSAKYNEGALVYSGHQLSKENINIILELCRKFNLLPSGIIVQLYLESYWGASRVGRADNNWSGMSGSAQTRPSGIKVTTGQRRAEGGTYFHYNTVSDFMYDYMYLLRQGGSYASAGKKDLESFIRGLFREGGAKYNYAASGYANYINLARSIRNGINGSNPGKLDKIDNIWKNPGTATQQVQAQTNSSTDQRVEKMIKWMEARKGKVTYSMAARTGPSSYDCSSAVYYAMKEGGFGGIGSWPFSTESEHGALTAAGYRLVAENKAFSIQRGDIIIWGKRGYSGGAGGHTMIAISNSDIIHCNFAANGISVNNYASYAAGKGKYAYLYRLPGAKPSGPVTQTVKTITKRANKAKQALDEIGKRKNQRVGSGQCYAVPALYAQIIGGPGLGGGVTGIHDAIGDTMAASNIGSGYNWGKFGWKVINGPKQSDLKDGQIYTVHANNASAGTGPYGHVGVIKEISGGTVIVYEQNVSGRMVICEDKYSMSHFMGFVKAVISPPEIAQGATIKGTTTTETVAGDETYIDYEVKEVEVEAKEDMYISSSRTQTWLNDAGAVEFELKDGSIRAPLSAELYPATLNGKDKWIVKRIRYETDSEDELIEEALAEIKRLAYPKIDYKLTLFKEYDLGDVVRIQSDDFDNQLILEFRIIQKTSHPITGRMSEYTLSNFKRLKSKVDESLTSRVSALVEEAQPYEIRINATNGTSFVNSVGDSVLEPVLVKNGVEVEGNDVTWRFMLDGAIAYVGDKYTIEPPESGKALLEVIGYIGNQEVANTHLTVTNVKDGAAGQKGADGTSSYIHTAWANSADGTKDFSVDNATDKIYMGTMTDTKEQDSTNPADYKWVKIKGDDGATGAPGKDGKDLKDVITNKNLILNSRFENEFDNWSLPSTGMLYETYENGVRLHNDPSIPYNTVRWNGFQQLVKVSPNTKYVLSWKEKSFNGKSGANIGAHIKSSETIQNQAWGRNPLVIQTQNGTDNLDIMIYGGDFKDTDFYISDIKLEAGDSPTPWTPSPEDLETRLNKKSDDVLTQKQLNALQEAADLQKAELAAKASMESLSQLEEAYKAFVEQSNLDKSASEQALIEAARRADYNLQQIGELKETKRFVDTYMTNSEEGLIIGKENQNSLIKISDNRISMFSSGKEVMYITQGVIHIDNGIFTKSLQIGKFVTREYELDADSNVVKFIG